MLSNQILQKTIYEMSDILECNCSIWNMDGEMLAVVGNERVHIKKLVDSFIKEHSNEKYLYTEEVALFQVCDEDRPVYIFGM